MNGDEIPDVDPRVAERYRKINALASKFENAEYNNLIAETGLVKWQGREVAQRVWIRIAATFLATTVIGAMFFAFYHILHQIFGFRYLLLSPGALIALVVAPIVSISGITIALLFGVFRGYKDTDAAAAGAAVAASITAAKGG